MVAFDLPSLFLCAQEMGVIGQNNQLPKKLAGRGRGIQSQLYDSEEEPRAETDFVPKADDRERWPAPKEDPTAEALSLFPQPKSLLTRVVQVATSTHRIRVGGCRPLRHKELRSQPGLFQTVCRPPPFTGDNSVQNGRRKGEEV